MVGSCQFRVCELSTVKWHPNSYRRWKFRKEFNQTYILSHFKWQTHSKFEVLSYRQTGNCQLSAISQYSCQFNNFFDWQMGNRELSTNFTLWIDNSTIRSAEKLATPNCHPILNIVQLTIWTIALLANWQPRTISQFQIVAANLTTGSYEELVITNCHPTSQCICQFKVLVCWRIGNLELSAILTVWLPIQ